MNSSILKFIKNINISSIAKNTGNTLNVVKKIIPVYKEIRPYVSKEKTIFKKEEIKKESIENPKYNDSLTFFK